jgi:hypothetical protein
MTLSRWVSLMISIFVAAAAVLRLPGKECFSMSLLLLLALIFIWFPKDVNEMTLGLWHAGYKIDSPTPPLMIAAFGWALLFVAALAAALGFQPDAAELGL